MDSTQLIAVLKGIALTVGIAAVMFSTNRISSKHLLAKIWVGAVAASWTFGVYVLLVNLVVLWHIRWGWGVLLLVVAAVCIISLCAFLGRILDQFLHRFWWWE